MNTAHAPSSSLPGPVLNSPKKQKQLERGVEPRTFRLLSGCSTTELYEQRMHGHTGARTLDRGVISTALYRLSYTTASGAHGRLRESNPWPLRPKRRIIPLDQSAFAVLFIRSSPSELNPSHGPARGRLLSFFAHCFSPLPSEIKITYYRRVKNAPAGNRTRGSPLATGNFTTKPLVQRQCHLWDLNPRVRTQYSLSVPPWTTRAR